MYKLLIGLLIIACIAPLFIKGPDGEPIMSLDDWSMELPDAARQLMGESLPTSPVSNDGPTAPTTVYRWQDENGQWHFSNQPRHADGAEEMTLDGDINRMEAYVPSAKQPASADAQVSLTGETGTSPQQIQQMMETVTNLQETIDQRKADMDKVVLPDG